MSTTSKGYLVSVLIFAIFIAFWHGATHTPGRAVTGIYLQQNELDLLLDKGMSAEDIRRLTEEGVPLEHMIAIADLGLTVTDLEMAGGIRAFGFTTGVGGAAESASTGFPTPAAVGREILRQMANPFYDRGPNDKGILLQLCYSLGRVGLGFGLALLVALPVGFLLGMSAIFRVALSPYIQILKPVSPLAWMPLALYTIKDAELSSIFVIFICSIWPMLINTSFGVAGVKSDWLNIGRTLELSRLRMALFIILPAAAPTILTGMRISIGIAWLVIVAAEMLIGGTGIGYFVWNEWNGLNLDSMIFAILVIGLVGLLLDAVIGAAMKFLSYKE
ncbi:MAG: nitrate ABC transporter permease [Verrucomicrobia bacterium]|nr:nitrate ABC transporter permease [Verrucomicrobiota bacterium]